MQRFAKTFSQPAKPVLPIGNKFTLDLAGLQLSAGQLEQVRQEAVKAAMIAAADILHGAGGGNPLADFGTFSTFSTFSTFGSGSHMPMERFRPALGRPALGADVTSVIENTLGAKLDH